MLVFTLWLAWCRNAQILFSNPIFLPRQLPKYFLWTSKIVKYIWELWVCPGWLSWKSHLLTCLKRVFFRKVVHSTWLPRTKYQIWMCMAFVSILEATCKLGFQHKFWPFDWVLQNIWRTQNHKSWRFHHEPVRSRVSNHDGWCLTWRWLRIRRLTDWVFLKLGLRWSVSSWNTFWGHHLYKTIRQGKWSWQSLQYQWVQLYCDAWVFSW